MCDPGGLHFKIPLILPAFLQPPTRQTDMKAPRKDGMVKASGRLHSHTYTTSLAMNSPASRAKRDNLLEQILNSERTQYL